MDTTKRYKAVFFDLGGTLRIALLEEPWMRHARRKMAEIAGAPVPYEEFYQMIEERYEPYRKWALAENKESGDEELWCKWLLPDYDQERIKQVCHELSFQYDGLDQYFDAVILSSVCHMRKPCFEIYQLAAQKMGVELSECVSVADNIKRDIPGAKKAGVGCNIIFSSPEKKHPVEFTEENRPDAVVEDFREILDLLPPLN